MACYDLMMIFVNGDQSWPFIKRVIALMIKCGRWTPMDVSYHLSIPWRSNGRHYTSIKFYMMMWLHRKAASQIRQL